MKVGIIGVGFVGDALYDSFQKLGVPVAVYDKYKDMGSWNAVIAAEILFLCLPTMYNCEEKCYDLKPLHEVLTILSKRKYSGVVVIKSTVEPGTCECLSKKYRLPIIHNPEFLTARTAREDFHQQKHIILGETTTAQGYVDRDDEGGALELVHGFYSKHYPKAKFSLVSAWESEAMKVMVNSFYAMKVQIFTEFYLLCQEKGADYNKILQLMLKNGWINPMHTRVPGPDGKVSYGGACFPKDTQALLEYMIREESPSEMLAACIRERGEMRSD